MVPHWKRIAERASAWEEVLRAGSFVECSLRYGIWDPPDRPFRSGEGWVASDLGHTTEEREFAQEALRDGVNQRVFEQVTEQEARCIVNQLGCYVSNSFVVWQGDGDQRKGRLVLNFKEQSTHWRKGSVKMETLEQFAQDLTKGDYLLTMDIKSGYHHFRLHPRMRNWFLFRNGDRFYRCIALPFGWGRSVWWFCRLLRPFVRELRRRGHRCLAWIDDFLIAPGSGQEPAGPEEALSASVEISDLMQSLGLKRHPEKGSWGSGSQLVEHLGIEIDTVLMKFRLPLRKVEKMRSLSRALLLESVKNRRWVSQGRLETACGVASSFILAYPLSQFHSRALHCDRHRVDKNPRPGKVRLSRAGIRDLQHWRSFAAGEGRDIAEKPEDASLHSDASDLGYGGTWGRQLGPGTPGDHQGQGLWQAEERRLTISVRELRAVRLLLLGHFASLAKGSEVRRVLLWEDNSAVVSAINRMVSKSPAMMSELRKLHRCLHHLGVHVSAQWLPSAVNRYADRLSRTWNVRDVSLNTWLLEELRRAYNLAPVPFRYPPMGDHPCALRKQAMQQLQDYWGDGTPRLWNPPPELIPLVLKKIRMESGEGLLLVPEWTAQPWWNRLTSQGGKVIRCLPPAAEGGPVWRRPRGDPGNERWRTAVVAFGRNKDCFIADGSAMQSRLH